MHDAQENREEARKGARRKGQDAGVFQMESRRIESRFQLACWPARQTLRPCQVLRSCRRTAGRGGEEGRMSMRGVRGCTAARMRFGSHVGRRG
eukprot:3520975-Pyramimonas_sp.AAC.1